MQQLKSTKERLILSIAVLVLGAVSLLYGLKFGDRTVLQKGDSDDKKAMTLTATEIIEDVTRDGLVRLDSGEIQRTYGKDEKPADFCAT